MSKRLLPPAGRHHAPGPALALLLGLCLSGHVRADDATPEHARLAAALRQLDSIERLVAQQAAQQHDEHARYHFDYARLSADLDRMRAGIRDYLTPTRAQPRDPSVLLGDYRQPAPPLEPQATP
ncbi:RAQPRD family integrative conjugative element protein [Stutzerimonas stutzeri]|uniref:integrative conjugative element protein, RAQPRD family n=1 Tax=Stutzerimonas stutzeri TaxID=316 RepID=UPI00244BF88A|nr:RAQPRD family integrative conjugative element protein [Stutzerimonas stutzeri]MDH0425379.1 RAQPRD family integrative conjugative element protein [Stutzerimonas stutzeri]